MRKTLFYLIINVSSSFKKTVLFLYSIDAKGMVFLGVQKLLLRFNHFSQMPHSSKFTSLLISSLFKIRFSHFSVTQFFQDISMG